MRMFAGLIAASLICHAAIAQNRPAVQPAQGQPAAQPAQGQGQSAKSDQEIAACLYLEASNEIEIAKFAQQKATNQEVRQFAEQMVREHSPGAQKMQQLAGNLVADRGGQNTGRGDGGLNWIAVKKEIGQQCLQSTKQELSQKSEKEFDQCFMTQQAMAHHHVVDALKVLRNHASQQLQQTIDQELQMAQHHLHQAKELVKKLDDGPSERVSRRQPEGNK
jgi:putative membrane protein